VDRQQKILAGAVAAALVVGLGFGFLIGKGAGGRRAGPSANIAQVQSGVFWPLFGHPRAASAPRAGLTKPAGFAVWKTRIDSSRTQPLACVELTRPLDPRKAYGDFVLVAPSAGGAPAVSARGDELCIGGLGFADHHVTLLKGLPAASGETLADNQEVDFAFGDKPPYVGFAGDGVILPREEADGVGIESMNVQKLAIEVWRVPDRNLVRREIAKTDPSGEGEYPGDWASRPDEEGQVVWKGQLQVRGDPGQKTTTVFPLGAVLKELKPGGYVIKAKDAAGNVSGGRDVKADDEGGQQPAQAMRWVMFTDMAVMAYQGSDGLDAVVRSLKSARPLAGIRVALVAKNGEDLAVGATDGQGRVRFPHPLMTGDGASHAKMLMAYGPQADLAILDLDRSPVDLSAQGVGGRAGAPSPTAGREAKTAVDSYVYADRGIYRPGEIVHLVAMVRDQRGQAITSRKGTLVIKRPSGVDFGRYAFSGADTGVVARDIVLPRDAPRGRWTASLQVEGIDDPSGQLSFSVEDFAPQRLAVTASGQEQTPVLAGKVRKVDVSARYLYGAPGAALQTQGEARIKADDNPFPQYKDYQWGDAAKPFDEKELDLSSTVTDGAGRAVLSFDPAQAGDADAPLSAEVVASVFEPGGRPVREGVQLKLRPRPVYLGVHVDQGESHNDEAAVSLQLIAVDAFGQRIAAPGTSWALVAENWDYDWFQTDGRWQWRRTSRDRTIAKGSADIGAATPARLNRSLGWGDYRLELTGPQGAKTVIRFSAGWGAPAKDAEAPDVARVSAGTRHYVQGDTVDIAIKAPYAGEAQVAVATDRVIDFRTLTVGKDGAKLSLKSSDLWGGGAYVLVTVIQPRDPAATPRPRRALGLVYVPLDPKGRKLTVDVGTPDKISSRAGIEIPIAVHGLHFGQRARVTVAAVDEGILRLTKQASPDPVNWYFGKRALSVDYRDDYGRLLDPNLGAPANVNFGGDEIGGEGLTTTPIKTVALWSGVVETGVDGRARVRLPAQADFNGQLRVMAVAWTDEAVGSGAKDMIVREPVIAELSLPRFLAPGDRAFATLELHNLEGRVGQYLAQITASGGVLAPFRKLYDLMLGQHVIERAPIAAPNVAGISQVRFSVSGPGFAQTKAYPIQTRLGWSPVTRTFIELQKPGEAFTPAPQLMSGLAAGSVTMDVSYSPFRGFDPGPIAVALNRYPYGCTEQIVSTAYPLLYAGEVSTDPRAQRAMAGLSGAVSRLLDRQTLDGAFGLWRVGDGEADPWLGAYATDFLIEAQKRGAAVPDDAIDRALSAMRQVSRPDGWASSSYRLTYPDWWAASKEASKAATQRMRSRASAYALYVLAKAGRGDLARLRWWHDVQMKAEPSPLARAQVAAGLMMMGDRARAHDGFLQAAQAVGYKRPALQIGPVVYVDSDDWYQSPLRDLAGVVALAYEAGETGVARQLQGRLEGAVKDPDALNTQEEAQLLRAAHVMLTAAGKIRIDASGVTTLPSSGGAPRWSVGRLASARFVNSGTGALWRTVTVRGTPIATPPAEAHALSVAKSFYGFTGGAADPAALRQGERMIVRLSGRNDQGRALPLVVDDALPAGYEIEMTLGPEDAQKGPFKFLGELSAASAQEARDDRYVAALNVPGGKDFAVAYVARAVTPGDFYLPGAEAHDMYKPGVFARTTGRRTHIAAGG
jgi:alpha-2-macroglobulin